MSPTEDSCELSVVVPVRNDGTRIRLVLEALCAHLSCRRGWEVLVVDDASDDDTCAQTLAFSLSWPNVFLLRDPSPLGCGYASRHGVNFARGQRIALISPDLPAPIDSLDRLEAALDAGHDLAFLSFRIDRDRPMPPVRIRSEVVRALLSVPAKSERPGDPPRPRLFQLYRRRAAVELFRRQRLHGSSFTVEILYLARRYGYSALEVAGGGGGRGAPETVEVGDLLKIRMHRLRGDYG
jgi:glycosyltransferase involved in cell wall biosynthesis